MNKEMLEQELEALSMTLVVGKEIKIKGESGEGKNLIELCIIPDMPDEKPLSLLVVSSKQSKDFVIKQLPLIKLEITIDEGYPSRNSPFVKVNGFYGRFEEELKSVLTEEKWTSEAMVLYDWYSYCKSEFISEIVRPKLLRGLLEVTSIEYQQLKEEEL